MQIKEAKLRFECGDLKKCTIVPSLLPMKWNVLLHSNFGKQVYLSRFRGGEASYTSIDAAYSAARKIGFHEVTIKI